MGFLIFYSRNLDDFFKATNVHRRMSKRINDAHFQNLLKSWPEKAFRYLYEHYYDSLLSLAEWRTGDRDAAEDIVQETFVELWQRHERIARIRELRIEPYLLGIVRNKSSAFFSKMAKLNENQLRYIRHVLQIAEMPVESAIISAEEKETIFRILSIFPERERQCLTLKFYEGMSNESVAMTLKVTVKAVERRVTSAYKRFRTYFDLLE